MRPAAVTTIFVIVVCVSILCIEGWRLETARRLQIGESEAAASNLAKALAEQAAGALGQADALTSSIVDQLETEGDSASVIDHLHRRLRLEMSRPTPLHRISVFGADGRWVTSSLDAMPSEIDHLDRAYFQYHLLHSNRAPYIGPPIRSRMTGKWIVTISRRYDDNQGRLRGIVVASIDLDYFSDYYRQFDLGLNGSVVLALSDGTVVDRLPWKEDIVGTSVAAGTLFRSHIAYDAAGTAWITSRIDGIDRLSAFQKVSVYPAFAIVSFSKEQVLRGWLEDSIVHIAVSVALVLVIGAFGRRIVRDIVQRQSEQTSLLSSKQSLEAANALLANLASEDGLTGLANRRAFDRQISEAVRRVDRTREPLAVLMLDIDHFKRYNDHWGHPQSDACIRIVADVVKQNMTRAGDFAARYGGEEFVVLLPDTTAEGAASVAERIRRSLASRALAHPEGVGGTVTLSIGISDVSGIDTGKSVADVIAEADAELYRAKTSGRDRVCCHSRESASLVEAAWA